MKLTMIKKWNDLAKTPLTAILLIEPSDKEPRCSFCGKSLKNNDYCYFAKEFKEFGCIDCIEEGEIEGIKTGFTISKLSHKYHSNVNVLPIQLKIND